MKCFPKFLYHYPCKFAQLLANSLCFLFRTMNSDYSGGNPKPLTLERGRFPKLLLILGRGGNPKPITLGCVGNPKPITFGCVGNPISLTLRSVGNPQPLTLGCGGNPKPRRRSRGSSQHL